jgi:hypothetical protein
MKSYKRFKNKNKYKYNKTHRGGFLFGTNKLTIDLDFNSDNGGFSALSSDKVKKFLLNSLRNGKNLIQTVPGKNFYTNKPTKLKLQAIKHTEFKMTPSWDEVECEVKDDWIKSSPCKVGSKDKVFVKYESNKNVAGFGVYLLRILIGDIDKEKHLEFVKVLKGTMKDNPVMIDNRDVQWFHLKSAAQ